MTSRLERLLADALHDAGSHVDPSPDLFTRIRSGIDTDRRRRHRQRRRIIATAATTAVATGGFVALVYRQGEPHMNWWILEVGAFALLAAIALILGPFIKRFGRSYAADVFSANQPARH